MHNLSQCTMGPSPSNPRKDCFRFRKRYLYISFTFDRYIWPQLNVTCGSGEWKKWEISAPWRGQPTKKLFWSLDLCAKFHLYQSLPSCFSSISTSLLTETLSPESLDSFSSVPNRFIRFWSKLSKVWAHTLMLWIDPLCNVSSWMKIKRSIVV